MVNRERFNNALLDNGIVQSRGDFSIGLAETASLFAQQSPGMRCAVLLYRQRVAAVPGKQLRKDG